jgi:lipid II:glycine glycyltransferase (peptidoglycan interpeptide bridge formation enzyme)
MAGNVVGYEHALALDRDVEVVKATFSRSQVTRNIARASREGVAVRRGLDPDDLLGVFYDLHLRTRRRQGVPIQPRRFFRLLWDRFLAHGRGVVFVAEVDGQPVAAAVFLGWKRVLVYKFGASDEAAWPRRPNHALFWEAIQWGCQEGFEMLDFGRTDLGNEGLRAFKAGWGTSETALVYSTLGRPAGVPAGGRLGGAMSAVIKRSPVNVCQFVGERLYRYAG